mmetsp:Transcript_28497/g.45822  ORF Transcript_28497/g.45822 Transcript_28497/m.45822 type:complete len:210 (+) Transcript_28497:255-884(+)
MSRTHRSLAWYIYAGKYHCLNNTGRWCCRAYRRSSQRSDRSSWSPFKWFNHIRHWCSNDGHSYECAKHDRRTLDCGCGNRIYIAHYALLHIRMLSYSHPGCNGSCHECYDSHWSNVSSCFRHHIVLHRAARWLALDVRRGRYSWIDDVLGHLHDARVPSMAFECGKERRCQKRTKTTSRWRFGSCHRRRVQSNFRRCGGRVSTRIETRP